MNKNSTLCNFINDHVENWRELLAEKNVRVKEEPPLAIFNYRQDADFSDPVVQEARGIIINLKTLEVVCWPFRKFGNWQEPYVDKIDWNTARVQEKVDGSIIKLWFDRRGGVSDAPSGKWRFSTNSCISAREAQAAETGRSYLDIIKSAVNYGAIRFDELDRDLTYIFELVSPEVPHAVKYPVAKLCHTGTRNNLTGIEENPDIGIQRPEEYPLKSLGDCIRAAEELNKGAASGVRGEGYVVVDADWHRIKVKSPEYIAASRLIESPVFPYKKVIDGIRNGTFTFDGLEETLPDKKHIILYYRWQMEEALYKTERECRLGDALYEEFSGNMKAVAEALKDDPLKHIAFIHLNRGQQADELLANMHLNQYLKFITPYNER